MTTETTPDHLENQLTRLAGRDTVTVVLVERELTWHHRSLLDLPPKLRCVEGNPIRRVGVEWVLNHNRRAVTNDGRNWAVVTELIAANGAPEQGKRDNCPQWSGIGETLEEEMPDRRGGDQVSEEAKESKGRNCAPCSKTRDIMAEKAKERQKTSTGGKRPQLVANFPQADAGKARDQAGAIHGEAPQTSQETPEPVTAPEADTVDRAHEAVDDGRIDYVVEVDVRGTIHLTVSR